MNWERIDGNKINSLSGKLSFWLGPEFAPFDKEPYYYALFVPGKMFAIFGFGVDLSFGWAEVWEGPEEWVNSGQYSWVLKVAVVPHTWMGSEIPEVILNEIARNKGKVAGGPGRMSEQVFFTAEYK